MVIGASWAGARAMTSTSGPGISLMSEFAGLVVLRRDSRRGVRHPARRAVDGPADAHRAGRPAVRRRSTRTATRGTCMLLPASVEECYEMAMEAFDLSERLQTHRLRDERPRPRHEHLDGRSRSRIPRSRSIAARCSTRPSCGSWAAPGAATRTSTATAIPWRSLPGTGMPAFFTRGSGHNEMAQYTERPDDYVKNLDRLARKFETAKTLVPRAGRRERPGGQGRHHRLSARATGRWRSRATSCARSPASRRRTCGCARIRSRRTSSDFIRRHDRVYVVEQNRDAQMLSLLRMDGDPRSDAARSQRAALQRPADRRPQHHRRSLGAGIER